MEELQPIPHVAYFSMEIAMEAAIPTYSGGLGVLAGDHLRTAADLGLPLVAITLASRQGYVRQEIVDGRQHDLPQPWDPARWTEPVSVKVPVRIDGREVWIGAWRYRIGTRCDSGRPVTVLLLDTDLPENHPEDRTLTDRLYGGDDTYRLKQEMVLGIGGVRLLQAMGVHVLKYHLNEGHAAFLALELLRAAQAAARHGENLEDAMQSVRRQCVFTTHTPVPEGHDQFDHDMAARCLGDIASPEVLRTTAGGERLNMTLLALSFSGWVNGVAARHAETSRALFPGYVVHAITNGVHAATWASEGHLALFDEHVRHWRHEPELLMHAENLSADALWGAHSNAKAALLAHAARTLPEPVGLQPRRLTLGFARRMTGYKRPHLLFHDLERLRAISRRYPLQVIFAGKAHPRDEDGKRAIEAIHQWSRELRGEVPVAFLPGYDMDEARLLAGGCDVWLNTPRPPMEASGTSGMKAAINGVPSLSILDGWWVEGWTEGVTGWAIGNGDHMDDAVDAASLYAKLEEQVAPLYYEQAARWKALMRNVVARNGALFNSHRMLRRYMLEAYSR